MTVTSRARLLLLSAAVAAAVLGPFPATADDPPFAGAETRAEHDARMQWWREARFGMFIHWGLYAIPAGEWRGRPVGGIGEWIQHIGQIPVAEYEPLVQQFNPVDFDADEWVRLAKRAGMRYIVITSKHHDGFALFDSAVSEYDVTATPYREDLLRKLADACHRHGIRICWYHSILDWHHPDYGPRRGWDHRPTDGADYERFVRYLKAQVRELLTNYGDIGVMWFDGEWDDTWTREHGQALYDYVRSLQPDVLVNNRVDKGRQGMQGMTREGFAGDFGTPEQEIPATGLPGVDWETCMTMNDTWGYKRDDHNWKSTEDLVRKLADIASKGGNFLLNVGPTAAGRIPDASIARLEAMGRWMDVNAEAIHGTSASPFSHLEWGRCTQRAYSSATTRLYLHVFDWPSDGALRVPGLANAPRRAWLLADPSEALDVRREGDALLISVPQAAPDPIDTVVVLDVDGAADICDPPMLTALHDQFVDGLEVTIDAARRDATARFTLDGTPPMISSPPAPSSIRLDRTATVSLRYFREGTPISGTYARTFTQVTPRPAIIVSDLASGVRFEHFLADLNSVVELEGLEPTRTGVSQGFEITDRDTDEHFGFRFRGFVEVPAAAMYRFTVSSDDGGRLSIGDEIVVDHDGLHAAYPKSGQIALAAGLHPIELLFFEKGGDESLDVWIDGPGLDHVRLEGAMLFHD